MTEAFGFGVVNVQLDRAHGDAGMDHVLGWDVFFQGAHLVSNVLAGVFFCPF